MKSALAAYFEKIKPFVEILKLKGSTIDISIVLATASIFGAIDIRVLWLALGGMCVHSGCDIINDIYDREIDKICKPKAPIPSGRMSVRTAWIYAGVLFFLSILIAFYLSKIMLICFIIGWIVGGIFYSHPRFRLKDIPVIAIAVTAFGFSLEAIGAWSVFAPLSSTAIQFGIYIFLLTFSLILLKDFRDVKGDIDSIPIRLGVPRAAKVCSVAIFTPMIALLIWFWNSKMIELLAAAVALLIALIPIGHLLLRRDPVSLGGKLKNHMFIAITTPNIAIFLTKYAIT